MLSVANSCHYNENSKNANIVYRQMPAPPELPQQIPWEKPQGGGKFLVQILEVHGGLGGGGWLLFEIDTCITWLQPSRCFLRNFKNSKPSHEAYQQKLNPKCIGKWIQQHATNALQGPYFTLTISFLNADMK